MKYISLPFFWSMMIKWFCVKGGTDAIFEVKDNLASGQPCVVVEVSKQVFNQNVPANFQSKCLWQFSIKFSIKVSPASRRVKVFAPPHPGLGQGGRHPCLCTPARKSQLCHRGLEPQAGLPALKYGSAVGNLRCNPGPCWADWGDAHVELQRPVARQGWPIKKI